MKKFSLFIICFLISIIVSCKKHSSILKISGHWIKYRNDTGYGLFINSRKQLFYSEISLKHMIFKSFKGKIVYSNNSIIKVKISKSNKIRIFKYKLNNEKLFFFDKSAFRDRKYYTRSKDRNITKQISLKLIGNWASTNPNNKSVFISIAKNGKLVFNVHFIKENRFIKLTGNILKLKSAKIQIKLLHSVLPIYFKLENNSREMIIGYNLNELISNIKIYQTNKLLLIDKNYYYIKTSTVN